MTTESILLSPFQSDGLSLSNRMAMAPMTRNRAGEGRVPTSMMATYYMQRASAGLLISESVDVSPGAIGYPGTPGIYTEEQKEGWSTLVQAVKLTTGTPFFCQLFHTGRVSHPSVRPDGSKPVAPSAIAADIQLYTPDGMQPAAEPEALSAEGIAEVVAEYVAAGEAAIDAGFDGVEVNAGNGYLIDQFLRDGSNTRTDAYGGDVEGRMRLLMDVVDGLCEAVGANRVGVRISPFNTTNGVSESDPESLFLAVASALADRGLAYLHVIESAASATLTPQLRKRFGGIVIANDGYDRDSAEAALQAGTADLVSFGRAFLANPDLPARFAAGAPLNEADPATFYGGTEQGYIDYPSMA